MNIKPAKVTGIIAIVAGILFILAGGVTWGLITSNLAAQNITVSEDADMLAGNDVNGPFAAFAEAQVIDKHSQAITEGKTYAELGAEVNAAKDAGDTALAEELQGKRTTVMNASFLRSSLFTSVIAYGVAALVMGLGVILAVIGTGLARVATAVPATVGAAKAEQLTNA